jgi:lysophospholipid acyltransferase (LPLAT)-like uncharacterized protein
MPESVKPPAVPAPASARKREINHVAWWIYAALWPVSILVRLWLASLRMSGDAKTIAAMSGERGSLVSCMWHNRILLGSELHRRYRPFIPMNALVSASKDGAWLVAFLDLIGVETVRGSSSWRGDRALIELSRKLKSGEDVAITPDGPRGPCYDFKKGPAALAMIAGRPVLLIGSTLSRAKRLRSWDKFAIPYPFSKVTLRAELVWPGDHPEATDEISFANLLRAKLMALTGDADVV